MLETITQLFGGTQNLAEVVAALGGFTVVARAVASPLLAIFYKSSWSSRVKKNATWGVSALLAAIGLFLSGAVTGSWLDVGTWVFVWGSIATGATEWHNTFWGSRGTTGGISTKIESFSWKDALIKIAEKKINDKMDDTVQSGEEVQVEGGTE